MSIDRAEHYERENLLQLVAEDDPFTIERYEQFARHLPSHARVVVDVGCGTGRGGTVLARARRDLQLWGIDVVQRRLDALPDVYRRRVRGLSTELPLEDRSVDAIVAGEFLEHLTPGDVDPTLCEFQRVLRIGGRLLLTTPNPSYVRIRLKGISVYGPGHLTQHHSSVLRHRLRMHGFAGVRTRGSGGASRYLGERVPVLPLYGSYLMVADKK